MHVLRLCSVYEPTGAVDGSAAGFDPIGGMQNHTACLSRCLDEAGVAQTVVTSRLGSPPGRTPLGARGTVVRVGVRTRRLRQLWGLCAVSAVLRPRSRVDVVHAHQGEDIATLALARLAARWHRVPLVVTVHLSVRHTLVGKSLRTRLLRALGGRLERATLLTADAVVVLAERTRRVLVADGVPADRVRVIPSGFEPELFRSTGADDPFPELGRPRIGYVGRLAAQKRADLVVRAFGRLRTPAYLAVVGDGPDRPRVHALVRGLPSPERAVLTGFVEHAAVPARLAALDVLVLPSAYEELGSVLVEALAAGVPVVATRVGGIPEVVRDGETGLLVPPDDLAALIAAVDRVLAEPGLGERLRAGARRHARRYCWPALAADVSRTYDAVLGRAAAPEPVAAGAASG